MRAGIPLSLLSLCENGRRPPSIDLLVQLLAALDWPSEEFGRYLGPWGEVETRLRYQGAAAELAAEAG